MLDAQPYSFCFSQGKTAKQLQAVPSSPLPVSLDSLSSPKGLLFSFLPASACAVCALECVSPFSFPFPPCPFPHPKPSQCPRCSGGASDPSPPSGWVQVPDFHFNSKFAAEASPPPRLVNKEPTVHGQDVQPALASLPSSMSLFSLPAEARGAGLLGDRLLAPGSMPLILSSSSLSPLRALWSIRGSFDSQLVFMRYWSNKKGRDKSNWSGGKGWRMRQGPWPKASVLQERVPQG